MEGRLLDVTLGDPYSNVALEEAIYRGVTEPTLRVWENQRSVVIGRAQLAEFETDLELCREKSIPVVRRMSAGGAVYHGPGNLNWSFFVPRGGSPLSGIGDAKAVFASFAALVVEALRECGVGCEFRPPNSIFEGGGKICGMAAYISREATLCHGTLLIDADLGEVLRLTKPKDARIERRYPRSRFAEVANCGVGRSEFVARLAGAGSGFRGGILTKAEEKALSRLVGRYRSSEWNLGDPFRRKDF